MIDTNFLNTVVEASTDTAPTTNREPLPEGYYEVVVSNRETPEWIPTTRNVKDKLTGVSKPTKFYELVLYYKVVEGEFAGRLLRDKLTSHPNISWSIPNFLNAIGVPNAPNGDIPTICEGKILKVRVVNKAVVTEEVDQETGGTKEVTNIYNNIKGTFRSAHYVEPTEQDYDLNELFTVK